jgi:hypothetical protein
MYVVAFAQCPALVKTPGVISISGAKFPLLYQGILWIDQATYRIAGIRTDLLAPLPRIMLEQATSVLNFAEVKIPQVEGSLWLPKEVEITWTISGSRMGERHRYSNYHLFRATATIVP